MAPTVVPGLAREEVEPRCLTKDDPVAVKPTTEVLSAWSARSIWDRFYLGLEFNPRYETGIPGIDSKFDWKM